ncbi:glycosyltransferase family 2 protein [Yoonia sp. F2084L]|uniref:glycosyltransferase family 2 protein n=1 Tax=Yoonia sp. F2084L TaxID=2926419 RepID=UPI001FF6018A|nr:glycosyltransferase family 2 protein [Yoonia sp. F2084L]MCK0097525.1 glycosyltransferase family 2 protein [Yoonia sp. F2084L]
MGIWTSYRLRLQRKRWRARALRKGRELQVVSDRTQDIAPDDILLFCTFRNEDVRLPFFLDYYRKLGINHFLLVDNDSSDAGRAYVLDQPDVSLWSTKAAYGEARYGVDWLTYLQGKYADGHWALTVDVDEFFVYPFCDTRPIRALADWLDASGARSFGAMLLDMYPKGPVGQTHYARGDDPFEVANWFDSGNYIMTKNKLLKNLWIQGGPRARSFFASKPKQAPALNKIPFVKWRKPYAYVSSTHMMLPRGLNLVYDQQGGEKTSGILLHAKFLNTFADRATEEAQRAEHYRAGREYKTYAERHGTDPDLWCQWSEQYINWRQLEILGLMSKGNWA